MRILLDQLFALPEPMVARGVRLERTEEGEADDFDVIESAGAQGCGAVCLLGERHLIEPAALAACGRAAGVVVVVVPGHDPSRATDRVRRYADRVLRFQPGEIVRLLADGPEVYKDPGG